MKIKHALIWLLINAGTSYAFYLGVNGNQGAANIAIFVTWFTFICIFFCIGFEAGCATIKEKGRSVPSYIALPYDILITLFLIYNGWFVTGSVVLLTAILVESIHMSPAKKLK